VAINIRLSGAQTGHRSESDVRFNYNNLLQLVGSCNTTTPSNEQFYSSDGGTTWSQSSLPTVSGDNFQSDPAVDWTSDGTAWALVVGVGTTGNVVRAFKSTDAGKTWTFDQSISGTQTNVDKPNLWIDHSPSSPHKDNMYALWWNNGPTYVARRAGPSGAWQVPQQVSGLETTGGSDGGDIKTNTYGDVFAFWPSEKSQKLFVSKSTDGGANWGTPVQIATTFASFLIGIPAQDLRTAGSSAGVLLYISGGAYRTATKDMVYAVWIDLAGGPGCNSSANDPGASTTATCKSRIWFSRSTDGGAHWDTPKKLNDQSSLNDQFHPRLAVDEMSGDLMVIYYDTVADPNRVKTDIWMQSSIDDGVSWRVPIKITSAQTDETAASADSGNQYGDYIGLTGFADRFFACWTDRRGGGVEEIWGAPIDLVKRACAFIIERSTLGQDEIDARRKQMRNTPNGLPVPDAFRVAVDGFTAAELGITGPGTTLNVASPAAGITVNCTGNTSDSGGYGTDVQRFTFDYTLDFPDDSAFGFAGATEFVTLNAAIASVSASSQIELIKQPNPFILHGDPPWLSVDLRVFVVHAEDTKFGVTMGVDASAAPGFIQQVMTNLNAGNGTAGADTFDSLPTDESAKLFINPYDENYEDKKVFNFALAKVHYIGLIGATNVRVFFRLFQAQTTSSAFDPSTTYRRAANNPSGQPIALAGIQGGEYVTIPCFATERIDPLAKGMDQQTDDFNRQDFTAIGGAEVDRYFGCWLDINQPYKPDGLTPKILLPLHVPATNVDGPFTDPTIPLMDIQQAMIRNLHQCLIAEIAFDAVSIPNGEDPSNWDKLAQRNLAWSDIGSAQALTTFEIRPTLNGLPPDQTPDELMIDWGNTPSGSSAQIYLPAVKVADVLEMAGRMYGAHRLVRVDDHTLECRTGGITYVPIPPAAVNINYAGLLSIDPLAGVRKGDVYHVVVRQVTNAFGRFTPPPPPPLHIALRRGSLSSDELKDIEWRRVSGAFQLTIPVKTKHALLPTEERQLSVLRWIAEAIPQHNRWYPVFRRYLQQIAGRVKVFGGDPTHILPSPTGEGRRKHRCHEEPEHKEFRAFTGKITGLIFDRFGDFEGFVVDTEDGEHKFFSREKEIEELAERVWAERLRITVFADRDEPQRPRSIIVREPPAPFRH
jgi:hypothetical protein